MNILKRTALSAVVALASVIAVSAQDPKDAQKQKAADAQNQDNTPKQELRYDEFDLVVTAQPRFGTTSDHFLTFSAPVAVPGMTLDPGTYLFRYPESGKNVMQVLNADDFGDDAEVLTSFQTINARDAKRSLETTTYGVTFHSKEEGQAAPPAIRELFLPGYVWGFQFVYPEN